MPSVAKRSRLRVGLVLGGGGVTGMAFHAGVLTALELDFDWDVRSADVVVGTSAGSIVAGLLRAGVPASDLAARAVGLDPAGSAPELSEGLAQPPRLPSFALRNLLRPLRIPDPSLVVGALRRPWRLDPVGTTMGLLRDGALDVAEHQDALRSVLGDRWPDQRTYLCAVRQRDLRRVVFGRDARATPAQAVAASCAVPGYFGPVRIGDESYVDGGVHSPTNATVLAGERLDLVIVSSPMSATHPGSMGLAAWARRYAGAKLRREIRMLRAQQIPTAVIEPGPELARMMGFDFMANDRVAKISGAAILDAGAQFQRPGYRTLLEGLGSSPRRRSAADEGLRAP